MKSFLFLCTLVLAFVPKVGHSHFDTTPNSPIHILPNEQLVYKQDSLGNRVPDFSYCGYEASEQPIPNIAVEAVVPIEDGDATDRIQKAIEYVSTLPFNENGFRGTVLLEKGTYEISGSLKIRSSGVVLRGSGCGADGTILKATGVDRETLIKVEGANNKIIEAPLSLENKYFPVNCKELSFPDDHMFHVGDQIIIIRPSSKEWIESIGADKIGIYVDYTLTKWEPGDFDMQWYRKVVAVNSKSIVLDAPITNSIDPKFGVGTVSRYSWSAKINHVGVENLRCISDYDHRNSKYENHRWMAITVNNASDSWVRRIDAVNFVSSAIAVWENANRITVEDCKSLDPIGEIGNYRRYAFQTLGQQVLFQRCYAEYAYHAFSVGFTAPGPNAFVQCYSYLPYQFSGALGGWSSGILFDNVTIDGGNISFDYRDVDGQGGGWSAANSLCWSCRAAQIHLCSPPEAENWAFASWAQGYGNGHHELQHTFVKPKSIYYAQLEARTGQKSIESEKILEYETPSTTAPTAELTAKLTQRSKTPDLIMDAWIDSMIVRYPIPNDKSAAISLDKGKGKKMLTDENAKIDYSIKNGWIVCGDKVATGKINRTSMWRGTTRPGDLLKASPNLVRFVPGRTGRGLTDDLDTLVSDMKNSDAIAMQNFPALWYERRRDDHARTRRADADVWPPFYEQPFSRSGIGEAFDRLSKYDLNKWNTWYWLRLKNYADLADNNGLLLIQEHYLQHNIIEEGAHWADYPWRSANNINDLGFAENPPYAGDKRVYMAKEFYDTTNVVRNQFHRAYIRKCLDNFSDNENVIHHLGIEYTGPLHFVEFWLDVISDWEKEHHKKVLVMLPGTKDVQDKILSDSKRSEIVNIIDIIQWQYREDSSLYAPKGGVSMAPRQYARIMDVGKSSFDQIYRAVNEYRKKYPSKAVVYSRYRNELANWAIFMAGGSMTSIPKINDAFLTEAAELKPINNDLANSGQYILGKKGIGYIYYYDRTKEIVIDLSNDTNTYSLKWINPHTGEMKESKVRAKGGKTITLTSPFENETVTWLTKTK